MFEVSSSCVPISKNNELNNTNNKIAINSYEDIDKMNSKIQPFFWQQALNHEDIHQGMFQTTPAPAHSQEFLIESSDLRNQYHHHQNYHNPTQNIKLNRRESAQFIPQSFERQMARNFQHLTNNSSPTNSCSLDTSIENSNQNSKYTDSTSVCTDHSLKDEDAWLPILNIAEEEV